MKNSIHTGIILMLTGFFILSNPARSQTATDSIKTTINKLFTAMKTSDGALLKTCFADSAILQTIVKNKEGAVVIKNESVDEFIASINGAKKDDLDERIEFETVKNDGTLGIAWTPYQFYYKGKFSHCGVNSFQLVRINNEWKIQYLIDTRRRMGCQ